VAGPVPDFAVLTYEPQCMKMHPNCLTNASQAFVPVFAGSPRQAHQPIARHLVGGATIHSVATASSVDGLKDSEQFSMSLVWLVVATCSKLLHLASFGKERLDVECRRGNI
jgi:hypothetical protein